MKVTDLMWSSQGLASHSEDQTTMLTKHSINEQLQRTSRKSLLETTGATLTTRITLALSTATPGQLSRRIRDTLKRKSISVMSLLVVFNGNTLHKVNINHQVLEAKAWVCAIDIFRKRHRLNSRTTSQAVDSEVALNQTIRTRPRMHHQIMEVRVSGVAPQTTKWIASTSRRSKTSISKTTMRTTRGKNQRKHQNNYSTIISSQLKRHLLVWIPIIMMATTSIRRTPISLELTTSSSSWTVIKTGKLDHRRALVHLPLSSILATHQAASHQLLSDIYKKDDQMKPVRP